MVNMVKIKTGKKFWKEMEPGTRVTFGVQGKLETYNLFYERMVYSNQYGEDLQYIVFHKEMNDMGNDRIARHFIMEEMKVKSVNGMDIELFYKEKKKELRKQKRRNKEYCSTTTEKKIGVKDVIKTKPVQDGNGVVITTKDGRYFCPCGNGYGRRDTAMFVHKKRHLQKKE